MVSEPLGTEQQLALYETMVRIRAMDDSLGRALSAGRYAAPHYPARGLEAVCAAIGFVLETSDYLVSNYRCVGDVVAKGVDLRLLGAEIYGRHAGLSKGKGGPMHVADVEHGLMATTGIVGAGLPIANGLALSSVLRGDGRVTVVTFGDGATSIGAFHEALNMASLWNLPVVFVCQNNQWGEHTPLEAYTKNTSVARRGDAYAMTALAVDGNDPVAVTQALKNAVAQARAGQGPTLLECITYRLGPHAFGSDYSYMPRNELEAAPDPVSAFRDLLANEGITSGEVLDGVAKAVAKEIADALDWAEAQPVTPDEELQSDVFASKEDIPSR